MTLLTYAAADGVVMCMSDSRTTYTDGRPPTDDAIKAIAYPLDRKPVAAEPLAVVMLAERSSFTVVDDALPQEQTMQAAQVVREALSRPPFARVDEPATATWNLLREYMFSCPACRAARGALYAEMQSEGWEDDFVELEAPGECGHDLQVHVVGFDPAAPALPVRYLRSWGSASPDQPFVTEDLPERTAFRTRFSAPEDRTALDYSPSPPG
ncbi:hypothetical protein [Nocardia asteroides]|uniref:hypothetical protein n=1 Tax=Nocardia asteroides TaxID=1824 RepID=UPI001E49D1CF|nr:hypothetical protein [Nocardia asteroides]UGT61792.1 hypothetical protein LTT61_00065 [Nocardia asteroides]